MNCILVIISKRISKIRAKAEPSKKKKNNFCSLKLILKNENIIITPHIASASKATFTAMGVAAANNIIAALQNNTIPSPVN